MGPALLNPHITRTVKNIASSVIDESIYASLLETQKTDSPDIGLLRDAAYKSTNLALDRKSQVRNITLSRCHKLAALLACDVLKDPPYTC